MQVRTALEGTKIMATFEGNKSNKSSARTKTAFLNAFLHLMREKTFDTIFVSDIIELAGYSRPTFYSYYQDKYDMVAKIIDEEAVNFVNAVCAPIPDDATMTFESDVFLPGLSLFRHVAERKELYYYLIHNMLPGYSMDSMCRKICRVFQRVLSIELTEECPNMNVDLYNYITTDTYLAFIKYWEMHDFSFTPEYLATQMMTNWVKIKKVSSVKVNALPPSINIIEMMG